MVLGPLAIYMEKTIFTHTPLLVQKLIPDGP